MNDFSRNPALDAKRFFLRILLPFALFLFAFLMVFDPIFTRFVINKKEGVGPGRLTHFIQNTDPYQVPILGSSKAREHYIPSIIGFHTHNYGLDGASLEVINMMLGFELEKERRSPIIIDFPLFFTDSIGDVANFIPLSGKAPVASLLEDNNEDKFYFHIPTLRYFGKYEYYTKEFLNERMQATERIERGFTHILYPNNPSEAKFQEMVNRRWENPVTFEVYEDQHEAFIRLVQAHPERTFLIVLSPAHRSFFQGLQNLDEAHAYLRKLEVIDNIHVLNYIDLFDDNALFRDTTHLNQRGATMFSEFLHERLAELDLPGLKAE